MLPPLQRLHVQPDRRYWGFQFMRHGVNKTVVVLTASHLSHEEDCIYHHSRNQESKEHDPEKQQHAFAPVEDDPTDVERDCERHQADAQNDEEYDGSTPTGDPHRPWLDSIALG